ncbi:hypothetical protein [Phenylobacterium sp.]|uniref:hypothetical protein n=1 Tax=Phenylobacterium sp. TaxID=1871053 RepID=UPI00374C8D79
MTDLAALKAEVDAVGAELLADPATPVKVRGYLMLAQAIRLLEAPLASIQPPDPPQRTAFVPPKVPMTDASGDVVAIMGRGSGKGKRSVDPNRVAILEEAATVLELVGDQTPMKTAEVYAYLQAETREKIGGTDRKGNLSAMMHHSPLFVSHGRKGWTLAPPQGVGVAPVVNVEDDARQQTEAYTFTA